MRYLKQSTAVDVALGPFLDSTDAITAETALTIAQADVRLKKNAAAWAQKNNATSCTHEENGWYECPFSTTDTDTLGILMVAVHEAGALPVWHEFTVLAANVYDSLIGGGDLLDVTIPGHTPQTGDTFARLGAPVGASISADIAGVPAAHLDLANGIETGLTPRGAMRLTAAAAAGKVSGAETTTAVIRNAVQDSKARITATVDANGNRTAITWDVT